MEFLRCCDKLAGAAHDALSHFHSNPRTPVIGRMPYRQARREIIPKVRRQQFASMDQLSREGRLERWMAPGWPRHAHMPQSHLRTLKHRVEGAAGRRIEQTRLQTDPRGLQRLLRPFQLHRESA